MEKATNTASKLFLSQSSNYGKPVVSDGTYSYSDKKSMEHSKSC